jgi:preprotein translocase subunit SecY
VSARRLLITIAVLLAWRLGSAIPVPGLILPSDSPLNSWHITTPWHAVPGPVWSIFVLGLGPIFSTLIVVELLKIASPAFRRWEAADRQGKVRLRLYILMASLVLAAAQALNLIPFYERFAVQPGAVFEVTFVICLVAGVALTCWLADAITLYGIGNGFWVLFSLPLLANLGRNIWFCLDTWWHSHDRSSRVWWYPSYIPTWAELGLVAAGLTIVSIFLLVFVLNSRLTARETREYPHKIHDPWADSTIMATVWPPILASSATLWLIIPIVVVLNMSTGLLPIAVALGAIALTPVFTILREESVLKQELDERSALQEGARPILTVALVQSTIWAVPLLWKQLNVPSAIIMDGYSIIIATTFALDLTKRLLFEPESTELRVAEPSA